MHLKFFEKYFHFWLSYLLPPCNWIGHLHLTKKSTKILSHLLSTNCFGKFPLKMIYSSHCQNQGEEIYIFAFTCQRFSCCKKIQPSDVAVMSFTLGKLLHSARYKLGKFVGRVQAKVQRKDFTEAWRRLCVQLCFQLLTPPLCFVLSRLVWMQLNIIRNVKHTNLWYVTTSRFTHFQVNFLGVKTTRM